MKIDQQTGEIMENSIHDVQKAVKKYDKEEKEESESPAEQSA